MKTYKNEKKKFNFLSKAVITLLAINLLPVSGIYLRLWPTEAAIHFYWFECALLGCVAILSHARRLIVFFTVLLALTSTLFAQNVVEGRELSVFITFWTFYSLFWYAYVETVKSAIGETVRRLHPARQLLLFLGYMLISIAACGALTVTLYGGWDIVVMLSASQFIFFFALALATPIISASILRIIDIIGPQHFLGLTIGTYFRPVERERVVMFIDMANSTEIAEGMKPHRSMALIGRLIFDVCAVLRHHGGDILNYTGDGLVALWPLRRAEQAVRSIEGIRQRLRRNAGFYRAEFGLIPEIRIGIHAGKVVIGQIGEEKLFLGLHGDVVNTAARLEKLNKSLGTKALISSDVVKLIPASESRDLDDLGLQTIQGRHEPVHVFAAP